MKNRLIEQLKQGGLKVQIYPNGEGECKDKDGYFHLFIDGYGHIFIDGKELLPEVKKKDVFSYPNGDGRYEDTNGYVYLFRDGKELLPEVKKIGAISNYNGDGQYADTNGIGHTVKGENNGK